MVVFEYRVVLPFTLEEYGRGYRYLCARQAKEIMAGSENGEQIARFKDGYFNEVPETIQLHGRIPERMALCRKGFYLCNRAHLGTRFPRWVRRFLPEAAFWIREEYWHAFPVTSSQSTSYSFCRYTSELWPQRLDFTIESLHVANDVGEQANVFGDMTANEQKECKMQFLDIAGPQTETTPGVFQGDPASFQSIQSGRGPLPGLGWWKRHAEIPRSPPMTELPLMCIYKRARCKVYILPFASPLERVIVESTVRDMAILGYKNLFCWTDYWWHLSHSDLNCLEEQVGLSLKPE